MIVDALVMMADAATLPEVTGTIGDLAPLGLGGWLLIQIGRLSSKVSSWLDSLSAHHKQVEENLTAICHTLRDLAIAVRRAGGIPDEVIRDFTPMPKELGADDLEDEESAPPERRSVLPRARAERTRADPRNDPRVDPQPPKRRGGDPR